MNKNNVQSFILMICMFILPGCGGGNNNGNSGNNNGGNPASLQIITPKTIYTKPGSNGSGYVVIKNPTDVTVSNINYNLTNIVGGASVTSIDSASASHCAIIAANDQCVVKINVGSATLAGSFKFLISSNNGLLNKIIKSTDVTSSAAVTIGIEQSLYNTASGADGVALSYYDTVINGTPYILASGLVASNNAGGFNNIVLVDGSGTELPNQQLIGNASNEQGSAFNILLPSPNGNNITQIIKVQTQQVSNGKTVAVSTAAASSTLTTKENIGIAELLPSAVYLTATHPEQIITIANIGDIAMQLEQLTSNSANVEVTFSPGSLLSGGTTTATLKLKDKTVAPATSNITLAYNNGQSDGSISGIVDQNVSPISGVIPTPPPGTIAGLTATFSPNNSFITTTGATVTNQLTITNTGDTNENNIVMTLPANFTISTGNSKSCIVTQGIGTAIIGDNLAAMDSCNVTVNYKNPNEVDTVQTTNIILAYNYNNGKEATPITTAVNYQVRQSTAILQISPSDYDFGSIVNNNVDSSNNILFTIVNTGDAIANSFTISITGMNASMFNTNYDGIAAGEACSTPTIQVGKSCKVNVKFGATLIATNSVSATLTANYLPYSEQAAIQAIANLSGVSVTTSSASINISNSVGSGFSNGTDGSSSNPYTLAVNTTGMLIYTYTNSGYQAANSFYVSNSSLPIGWVRSGGTCPASSVSAITLPSKASSSNSCTVEFSINSPTAEVNNFNRDVMEAHWTDVAHTSGRDEPISSLQTYVTVILSPLASNAFNILPVRGME